VGLNMFFVLGGASNILSMREKQNLWRVMGERFTKLIVAFFFGFLLMGLPVSLTMLLYQEGTILDAPAKAWRKVLVASPGPLYFLPYMFALWVLHLPYFCVMKACYERNSASASSQSSEKTPPSSTGDHFQQPSLPPPFFSSQVLALLSLLVMLWLLPAPHTHLQHRRTTMASNHGGRSSCCLAEQY